MTLSVVSTQDRGSESSVSAVPVGISLDDVLSCVGSTWAMRCWPGLQLTAPLVKEKGGAEQSQAFQMPLQDFTQAHQLSG